jgi:hypothetical protein
LPTGDLYMVYMVFELFEPIIGYKQPTIASGATPIGSAGRVPDRKTILRKNSTKEMKRKKIRAYDRLQVPDHILRGYSHRERWSHT